MEEKYQYKKGDIIVSLTQSGDGLSRFEGSLLEFTKHSNNCMWYINLKGIEKNTEAYSEFRIANSIEIKAYKQGIRNINDIPIDLSILSQVEIY